MSTPTDNKLLHAHQLEQHIAAGMEVKPLSSLITKSQAESIHLSDEALKAGVVIEVDLSTHEAAIPNGVDMPDRFGYFYTETDDSARDQFRQPLFTLSEWRDSYNWEQNAQSNNAPPQLLINTSWFNTWQNATPLRKQARTSLAGLCISNGEIISSNDQLLEGEVGLDAIIIDNNHSCATLIKHDAVDEYVDKNNESLASVSAAAGFIIRKDGVTQNTPDAINKHHQRIPRMGIGISGDGKKMLIIAIQTSNPTEGVTVDEFSSIFATLDCPNAINLENSGATELLYDGPDHLGRERRFQTVTCDQINVTPQSNQMKHDSERPKPAPMTFSYKQNQKSLTKDDTFIPHKKNVLYDIQLKPTLDDSYTQDPSIPMHDSYFNHREKVRLETEMARAFMQDVSITRAPCAKIARRLIEMYSRLSESLDKGVIDSNSLDGKFIKILMSGSIDFHVLYNTPHIQTKALIEAILKDLRGDPTDPNIFYRQMCIARPFIVFLTKNATLTADGVQARNEAWMGGLFDVSKFETDTQNYRGNLTDNTVRKERSTVNPGGTRTRDQKIKPSIFNKLTSSLGALAPEDEKNQPKNELPYHTPGKSDFFMTAKGEFVQSGMHTYDMPQLCGPSVTTAARMALANQCGLSNEEMENYFYGVSMYHIAIGAHTVDECFSIGKGQPWNHYVRGDYSSIVNQKTNTPPPPRL